MFIDEQIVEVGRDRIVRHGWESGRSNPAVIIEKIDPEDEPRSSFFERLDSLIRIFADELFEGSEPSSEWLDRASVKTVKLNFSEDQEDGGYTLSLSISIERTAKKSVPIKLPPMQWEDVRISGAEKLVSDLCAEARIYLDRTPAKTQMALEV
jgi:hypothetical protein